MAPLIGHGWPKGNPLKALFAQGNALGIHDRNILALSERKFPKGKMYIVK